MNNDWNQNDPKTGFIVTKNERLSNLASESIDWLYQPVIGVTATALIRLLWRYSEDQTNPYVQRQHYELFSFLQIDAKKFNECRGRLEGAGLLRTFVQKTDSKPVLIYQLIPPLSNRAFFDDDLLSLALLENVGEATYQKLAQRLLIKPFEMDDTEEITQNFLDSFQIDADQITDQPQSIVNLKHDYDLNQPNDDDVKLPSPNYDHRDFSFQLVLDCLKSSYVNVEQVKRQYQLIINEHELYGIDELKMAQLIMRATNIRNNVFSPDKLKLLISRQYQTNNQSVKTVVEESNNEKNKTDFDANDRSLIKAADYYAPLEFINRLKESKNGFVTQSEENMVANLVDQRIMSTGAVNMLVYHIIVNQEKPQLSKNLFDFIANDWVQKYHVKTATDAMNAIKAYNRKQKENKKLGHYGRSNYRKSNGQHKDLRPTWMKEGLDNQVIKPVSEEERRAVIAKIEKIRNKK